MNNTVYDLSTLGVKELLALSIREGNRNADKIADELVAKFGDLRELTSLAIEELEAAGFSYSVAWKIKAILELAKRIATLPPNDRTTIRTPKDAADLLMNQMRLLDREHFKAVLMDTKNHVLDIVTISVGTLNSSLVHPRELFKEAIKRSCAGIILAHNHPSGIPDPSSEDKSLTNRLVDAGKLLGITILDHVIIGDSKYFSFRESGLM
jgi:DNA repair protein RadC